jgi:hypothetical protein
MYAAYRPPVLVLAEEHEWERWRLITPHLMRNQLITVRSTTTVTTAITARRSSLGIRYPGLQIAPSAMSATG